MNIVEVAGLEPAFRLYESGGVHARVKVDAVDALNGLYHVTAQVADDTGQPVGPVSETHVLRHKQDQTDLPRFAVGRDGGTKGLLLKEAGRLFEHDGDQWLDRGPLPASAADGTAEILVVWDKAARAAAEKAIRAWGRQASMAEIRALIGAA